MSIMHFVQKKKPLQELKRQRSCTGRGVWRAMCRDVETDGLRVSTTVLFLCPVSISGQPETILAQLMSFD
jgi:hypothetical protein